MKHGFQFTNQDLQLLLVELLRTRHITQPLIACEIDEDAQAIREKMLSQGLSVLGVRDKGHVIGSIDMRQLEAGPPRQHFETLADQHVISAEAPLLELLEKLKDRHWLFVRRDREIEGFVSRSDLQRAPVRLLIFGLISMFEVQLLSLVQRRYSEKQIAETLNANRLALAQRLHHERELRGEELQLADCLQIADKRDLLLASAGCSRRLGFASNKAANRFFVRVEQLRDRLVHANDLIAGSSWSELLSTTLELADFLERCISELE